MNYLKFTQYIYLIAGVFFIYFGFARYQEGEEGFWIWFIIVVLAIFMFFFRRKFAAKFEEHDRNKQK